MIEGNLDMILQMVFEKQEDLNKKQGTQIIIKSLIVLLLMKERFLTQLTPQLEGDFKLYRMIEENLNLVLQMVIEKELEEKWRTKVM